MNCELASRYLDSFVDGELEPGIEHELEEHLRTCSDCQCQVWETREVRSLFRQYAPQFKAPPQLRAKVLSVIKRPQETPLLRLDRLIWMAAAAMVVIGLMAFFLRSLPDHGKEVSQLAVADYSQFVSSGSAVELTSEDFGVLKPWFAEKIGFSPPSISLHDYGYRLAGGRVATLGKRPVVALVYNRAGETLEIYCWPPNQDPVAYAERSIDGFRVYSWSNSACNYILVVQSDDPKIDRFVESFQDQPSGSGVFY